MAKRCSRCGVEKDESEFNRREKGSVGLQGRCRSCNSEYLKQHYRDNPEYYKAKARSTNNRIRARNQRRLREYFATHPCVDCGETDPWFCSSTTFVARSSATSVRWSARR